MAEVCVGKIRNLYSRVDYQKKKEICRDNRNQNDSLGIAKPRLSFCRLGIWQWTRYPFGKMNVILNQLEWMPKLWKV